MLRDAIAVIVLVLTVTTAIYGWWAAFAQLVFVAVLLIASLYTPHG